MGFRVGWFGKYGGVTWGASGPRGYLFGRGRKKSGCLLVFAGALAAAAGVLLAAA